MSPLTIITKCPHHPSKPDPLRACSLCVTAIEVNSMNPGWAAAGYNPVSSWSGPGTFLLSLPPVPR